MNELKVANVN